MTPFQRCSDRLGIDAQASSHVVAGRHNQSKWVTGFECSLLAVCPISERFWTLSSSFTGGSSP